MDEHPPPTDDPLFPKLTERVLNGECVAFVGAGMSANRVPDWKALVKKLCERCGVEKTSDEQGNSLNHMHLASEALKANKVEYENTLLKIFGCGIEPEYRHFLLAKIPFKFYLTTNYDNLICEAKAVIEDGHPQFHTYPRLFSTKLAYRQVAYLHGRISKSTSRDALNIVLTHEDYRRAYGSGTFSVRDFLMQIIPFHSICFIGCGQNDPYLRGVIETCSDCRTTLQQEGHRINEEWYFLLDRKEIFTPKWKYAGTRPVRFDKESSEYEGLRSILEYWSNRQEPQLNNLGGGVSDVYGPDIEVPRD